jgi:hypothetical protein
VAATVAGTAIAHEYDHAPPSGSQATPLSSGVNAGGENAHWELVGTLPTGNPQTDLDFFTSGGITYMSVGSLAAGPNSAGQNIIQLTTPEGEVEPTYVTGHPSATCPKATSSATGLQHDPEAAPKGQALLQWPNPYVDVSDTQIVVDATDATGRCHDQGALGVSAAPQGGLEIIDVTDPAGPKEIGLTSHVGQAHTVNVDPKRPHIAFVSSSDAVNYDDKGVRANDEHPKPPPDGQAAPGAVTNAMDGIEVVDMSTCMNFPPGATLQFKRDSCKPQVYRYRWPNADFASSHTFRATGACHELEIYPDDKIACAALMASLLLDFSGAFDDNGTPTDYTDDKLRGTPLPCAVRNSSTAADPWKTGAKVTDCVIGEGNQSLRIPDWEKMAPVPPSLEGVKKIGAAHHMGFENQQRDNVRPPYDAKTDVFVSHEAELSQSGRYMFVTDERGGGVLPVGASCAPRADNPFGNGGIHAFAVDKLGTAAPKPGGPADAVDAYRKAVYAKDPSGNNAIFRTEIRTEPQGNGCTSHVFQQIPGQNRIFMGWYSQGTQVVDFTENPDGTIEFKNSGYFVPENANTWTSHIFKVQENQDGTFTYWGATGDFAAGDAGRNAVDVYKVTMPAPPKPRTVSGEPPAGTPTFPVSETKGVERGADPPACATAAGFETIAAQPVRRRKRVRFSFTRRSANGVDVQVFRHSGKKRRLRNRRVAHFASRTEPFTWKPRRRTANGFYSARFTVTAPNGGRDVRHVALRRKRGRFFVRPAFDRRAACELFKYVTLGKPVFGGKRRKPLFVKFKLRTSASVTVEIARRGKVVKRVGAQSYARGRHSVRLRPRKTAKRGTYTVTLKADRPGQASELTLYSRYL